MSNNPSEKAKESSGSLPNREREILGLDTDELAGLSVEELAGNKTAVTMVMHYYRVLLDENISLRNDLNTAQTYVEGYGRKKTNSMVGAILLLLANVFIGFGVNLITSKEMWLGFALLIPGLCMAGAGTYFSIKVQ